MKSEDMIREKLEDEESLEYSDPSVLITLRWVLDE